MASPLGSSSWGLLAVAAGLDFLLGDPWDWLHPVQVIGAVIQGGTDLSLALSRRIPMTPLVQRLFLRGAGLGLTLMVIGGTGILSWGLVQITHHLPWGSWAWGVGWGLQGLLLASCLAGRSLRLAALSVLTPLQAGDLFAARQMLSRYVGRDTVDLSETEILRAVLETVTENATDGVLGPLFYAGVGCFIPGLGPLPLAMAYKAASTLDSMIGYRRPPFTDIGWAAAKLEDGVTWVPCRLVVASLILLSGQPRQAWAICQRDAPQDPSPNAGWSECAYAVFLGVQMGGENYYQGKRQTKPYLGEARQPISMATIHKALTLTRTLFLGWLGVLLVLLAWVRWG